MNKKRNKVLVVFRSSIGNTGSTLSTDELSYNSRTYPTLDAASKAILAARRKHKAVEATGAKLTVDVYEIKHIFQRTFVSAKKKRMDTSGI